MGNEFVNVDLVRFSQTAQPLAKTFDKDKNGTLDKDEYNEFIGKWNAEHKDKNPLLMQLHIKTLNQEAEKIAKICDKDNYKGVLTESEIQEFMSLCEKLNIKNPFKKGTSVKAVLTGDDSTKLTSNKVFQDKGDSFLDEYFVKCALFANWLKLDVMGFKGSDKFFHAVGNYEAMSAGAEKCVKKVCAGQDQDKRKNSKRPEADYTEDLYANWLGREFAKMYPGKEPHDLFAPLAPNGFDVEKSKKSPAALMREASKNKDGYFVKKYKQYTGYLKEKYVRERFVKEIKDIFGL